MVMGAVWVEVLDNMGGGARSVGSDGSSMGSGGSSKGGGGNRCVWEGWRHICAGFT